MVYRTLSAGALDLPRVLPLLGLLAASFLMGSGCSGHPPYPKTWPALRPVARQSCERVAGSYWNEGERGQMEDYGPAYLIEMLSGPGSSQIVAVNKPRPAAKETVTLSFPFPDQLDVVIAGTEPVPRRLSLSRKAGQFNCDGSTLVIEPTPGERTYTVAPGGAFVVGGKSVVMKLDLVNSYLIVTRREKDYLWLPFPGWSTWSSWYRFHKAPTSTLGRQ